MSVEVLYLLRKNEPEAQLQELDDVALLADVVTDEGDTIKAGTEGTIVGVWRPGELFEVEFAEPEGALATVEVSGLARASDNEPQGPGIHSSV